jgi:hypothetical protein
VFLRPGGRLKLHPDDLYAYGLDRGGIDERWFASTTPTASASRSPDEGLSYVVVGKNRFTLRRAVEECGSLLVGESIWSKYKKWPVYAKFFDNAGPIPHHMHQSSAQAALVGEEGKPEAYYFLAAEPGQKCLSVSSWASSRARQSGGSQMPRGLNKETTAFWNLACLSSQDRFGLAH